MKSSQHFRSKHRGSVLLTVTLVIAVMAILSASILKYSLTERRGNERNRLTIRAQNTAENISLYAAEQLTTKLYRLGSAPVGRFPSSGTSTSVIRLPVADLSSTSNVLLSEFNPTAAGMEVRAAIESATAYVLVNDPTSTNNGLQVGTAKIPIISKGTATLPEIGTITAYVEQDMELSLTPLFQFGLFYNMDLELYPSALFTVSGPVHTNKSLMAHPDHGSNQTIKFTDRVTAAEYIVANQALKAATRYGDGSMPTATPNNGNVVFTHTDGVATTPMKDASNNWRDCRWLDPATYPPIAANVDLFNSWAAQNSVYNANVKAKSNPLELPGIGTYKQVDDPATPEDERNNGRQIIESPDHKRWDGTAFTATADTADLKQIKISWRAGLYIMVNPDDTQLRTGKLPNGTTVTLLPRSYRCWLNKINSDGSHTVREVVLPGQPSYGYNDNGTAGSTADDYMYKNDLPNQFTNTTSVGPNQVLRIPTGGNTWDALVTPLSSAVVDTAATASPIQTTGYGLSGGSGAAFPADSAAQPYAADAYFFDLRRANGSGSMSTVSGATAFGRGSATFVPRPIAKIDFDMGRFKMMVSRVISAATTSTGYKLDLPLASDPASGASSMWGYCIYNSGASPTSFGLGVLSGGSYSDATNCFPTSVNVTTQQRRDPFQLYYAPTATSTPAAPALPTDYTTMAVPAADLTAAWYDGVAIYLHSLDAEQRSQTSGVADRLDSGVRLWNGRGPLPSLTITTKTGCTFATNDAVYIVGHYNADGHIDSSDTDIGTGSPDYYGGYSATYPDSAGEYLSSVFGDAIMILSQPTFTRNGSGPYTFDQTSGWADAKSALPASGSSASDWDTAGGGSTDGVSSPTAIKPGVLPNLNTPSTSSGAAASGNKLFAQDTEISTALVVGIVPSHHNPTGLTDRSPTSGTAGGGVYVTVSGVAGNNVNSGGANNFPRLLEDWSGDLYIRGSMVALFESRVAMEPFTHSRCYGAPGRFWGLHYKFSQASHDVPLEPIVLGATRLGFRRLTPGEYAARKTSIEAMTAIP